MIGWNREQQRQDAACLCTKLTPKRHQSSRLSNLVDQLICLATLLPVLFVLLELVPCSSNRKRSLVGEGVQRNEAIHMDPVVLTQTDPVRLQLAHGLVTDLLGRLGLALSLRLQVKQDYLA